MDVTEVYAVGFKAGRREGITGALNNLMEAENINDVRDVIDNLKDYLKADIEFYG